VAERERRINNLMASTSWRITGPLRAAGRALRRLRRSGR
jgi:hypothetical protein